ncbi:MAG: prolipoprotein diacylglyceryl transferase [Planctomycetota bacterium]
MDPVIFSLGPVQLRWYGLLFASGFLIGYSVVQWMYRQEGKPEKDLDTLCVTLVLGTIVGARLGHCLFYEPAKYLADPLSILKVWEGGLASHGGVIGNLLALWWYARKRPDQPYIWLLDRVCVPTALTACFIRLGNFFNSEIVGKVTDVPWAIIFVRNSRPPVMEPRHPAQLYEAACYFGVFLLLLWMYRRKKAATPHGLLIGLFMVLVFAARFAIEYVKEPQIEALRDASLSMGQWLSLPAIAFGIWLIVRSRRAVPTP